MLGFSACIEWLFAREAPEFSDRVNLVARSVLPAIEFWSWRDKDLDAIVQAKDEHGLMVSSICCLPCPPLVVLSNANDVIQAVRESVSACKKLGSRQLIILTGNELENTERMEQHDAIVGCLKAVAPVAEDSGIVLILEPLNTMVDHAGYYLVNSDESFEIISEVDSPGIRLLFDIYHQQISDGNLIESITKNIELIGHFHAADVPGRHELGTGEINWANIFTAIEGADYDGFIGLEYVPTGDTESSLADLKRIRSRLHA